MAGRDAGEGIIAVRIRVDAGDYRLARISEAVGVHVLNKVNFNVGNARLANIVGAVAIGVIPHRAADGGIQRRGGNVLEEIRIRDSGQIVTFNERRLFSGAMLA